MKVSISKQWLKKGDTKFKGRLFYAIIPNHKSKSVTFYFLEQIPRRHAASLRGFLCLFETTLNSTLLFFLIRSPLCGNGGSLELGRKNLLNCAGGKEKDKLDDMEANLTADREVYISKDQQIAMAMDGNDDGSIESRLTKGDKAPPSAKKATDEISALTGETRESKAKAYAAEELKKVATQYVGTISNLTSKLEGSTNAVADLEARLAHALRQLKCNNGSADDV